ncbi:MAG: YaeQ family protein [Acidobacteriota bacterium]
MALSSTVYNLDVSLADVDRGVYETLALRVALHPSESLDYMLTRVLAYCLQYEEGITFSRGGISDPDEPPIRILDPTGRITAWIEIGAPDAERLNKAAKAADRVAVYTHKNPATLLRQFAGRRIHHAEEIPIYAFDRTMIEEAAQHLERRTQIDLSLTGGQLYLSLGDRSFSGTMTQHRIAE